MSGSRFGPHQRVRFAAVTALLLGCVASAQPPRGPSDGPPPTTLYLVIRTGPAETEKGILTTLKKGLEKSGALNPGDPTIKALSPALYEELQSLVDRAATPATPAEEGVSIRLLPTRDAIYEIKLQPTQVLKKLRVKYQKAGQKEYTPAAPAAKQPLVLTVPGRYAFTPEPEDTPVSYDGDVAEIGKKDAVIKGEWPSGDKFYVVTIRNFDADPAVRRRLFEVIKDKTQVANPLDYVQLENDLLFAFASLGSNVPPPGVDELDKENNLTITVETLERRSPRRVWVYFPLDREGAQAAKAEFGKLDSLQLPAKVRENGLTADNKAVVKSTDAPKWLELPPEPAPPGMEPRRFARKVKLDDVDQFAAKYSQLWMLVVWEFDAGTRGKEEAIRVSHNGEQVYVLDRERAGWQRVIQRVARPKAPDPKP